MKLRFLLILFIAVISYGQTRFDKINEEISAGNFTEASRFIKEVISNDDLSPEDIYELEFEIEKMSRIRKDFQKSADDVLNYVRKYYSDADENYLKQWRDDGTLEYKIIDGEVKYFNRSHANLFRVNKEAKKQKEKMDGFKKDQLDIFLEEYLPNVVNESKLKNKNLIKPITLKLNYTITVDADAVPAEEVIRCWLPYPREGNERQTNIELISTNVSDYIIAGNNNMQRTIYMEKKAAEGIPIIFNIELKYDSYNQLIKIDPKEIKDYDTNSELYKYFTAERKPHIVFSEKIKKLSQTLVAEETNPYHKAKKIFTWISENIPWAGAREYSTIENISDYCVSKKYGDCGIKTLLLMTLCRYNGIPTKWQSGWMLHPGEVNLHDWGELYFEGIGWVPVDQSFGLVDSDDEDVRYFYLGGMDAYRLIANDGYSQLLYPAKIYPRSETVDFQRGELEWRGGNLYFDKWDYDMRVEYIDAE